MLKKIKNLLKTGEICGIFSNTENTNKFAVGYITACDKEFVIFQSIDQYGNYDGFQCLQMQNIIKIETKTVYLKNIEKLYRYRNHIEHTSCKAENNLLLSFINSIYEKQKNCTIELCDSQYEDATGFINCIDCESNTLEVKIISDDGVENGNVLIDISMISCITYESFDDVKRETLLKLNCGQL